MEWLEEDIAAQGTGAEAAREAGQPMVVQQADVGSEPEGKGAGEGMCAKRRELKLEGWRAWKAGRIEKFRAQGHSGHWYGVRDPGWLRVDYAAWKAFWAQRQRDREGKEGEEGASDAELTLSTPPHHSG